MKRLAVGLLLLSLILALSPVLPNNGATARPPGPWRIGLYIPPQDLAIDLGTVDSSCYDIKTASWCTISDGRQHTAWIFVLLWSKKIPAPAELAGLPDETGPALPGGVNYSLVVTARDTGPTRIDDLADLQITGGELKGWTGLDKTATLFVVNTFGVFRINDIQYRYQADLHDRPGDYGVTITYTILPQ
ncbi:MAG: hypothetical protein U9M97_03110 [Candidatus Hadarchaeota archaeon]|nr:hypothetical protein [Candidatus Hadarchaeota archaeon]